MHTKTLLKSLGIQFPIIQAPMSGSTSAGLVAAVSNAGGLGSLGAAYMSADELRLALRKIRSLTDKPFAVNLFIPEEAQASSEQIQQAWALVEEACAELRFKVPLLEPPYTHSFIEQMNVLCEEEAPIFSFTFGIPSDYWINKLKAQGTLLIGTATKLQEALMLEQAGVDIVTAQGSEAGGHRGTFSGKAEDALIGLLSLLPQLRDQLSIPVVAAGGIMDARGIKAALNLGAAAVQMGTAFLTCHESTIHPQYKAALLNTKEDNTVLTKAFSGKLARGIRNKFSERLAEKTSQLLPYPIQNALTRSLRVEAAKQANPDFMSLWAGQAAYLCQEKSAAELINTWMQELRLLD